MTYDSVNSMFELSGGFFIALHVLRLWRDKEVKGVSVIAVSFFSLWGYWNLIYYNGIGQLFSVFASLGTALVNTLWVGMIVYYTFIRRKHD